MRHHVAKIAHRAWNGLKQWCLDRFHECITCRVCGKAVHFWDECCTHCGGGNPAKISISAAIVVGVGCAFLLVLLTVC